MLRDLCLAAAVALLVLAPTLLYPYGRDQAVFAYVGRVIAEGGMPYRDAWDLKPPGIYLAYAILGRLFPTPAENAMAALRVVDVLLAAVTAALLAVFARRAGCPKAGVAAGAWYAALYLQGGYWSLGQAEAWANPLLLGGALLLWPRSEGRPERAGLWTWAVAGVLAGGALLLKFTTVLLLLPAAVIGLRSAPEHGPRRLLALVAGAAVPLIAAGAWLASGGALGAYFEIQRGFVAPYTRLTASGPLEHVARAGAYTGTWLLGAWLPAALALLALAMRKSAGNPGSGVVRWMAAAGLLAVWIQDKYFGYHWQTLLPALALLAAFGAVAGAARAGFRPLPAALALLLPLAWAVGRNWSVYRDGAARVAGRISQEEWLARFGRPWKGDNSYLANTWAAREVARWSAPGESILVWGFEPSIYLLADRRPPTRYFFNVPVTSKFTPVGWRYEFLRDLQERPPALVIVARNDAIPWASGLTTDSAAQLQEWPELSNWLRANYREESRVEYFTFYRRIGQAPGDGASREARGGGL